ncbi:Beta-mannosidase, partial [Globisporangium splendens]
MAVNVLLPLLLLACSGALSVAQKLPLTTWSFRSQNGSIRIENASVPGTSHMHLQAAGLIEDPYLRFNEREYQWVAKEMWVYETQFTVSDDDALQNSKLVFETLDGIAQVFVNDKHVASTVDSFMSYAFEMERLLVRGTNIVKVEFAPPLDYALIQSEQYPYFVPATQNFNTWAEPTHRSFIRKAGSDFGWDWGPAFATSGIAGSVYIEFGASAPELKSLDVIQEFPQGEHNLSVVQLTIQVSVDGKGSQHENVTFELFVNDVLQASEVARISEGQDGENVVNLSYVLENPVLWWPNGYGEPYLYDVKVIARNEQFNTSISHKTGVRHVALIQDDTVAGNTSGKTFYFKINQVPVFVKGANWIPTDSFPTRVQASNVKQLIRSAYEANMNMIRVWGGGRYESDDFYSECDRLGMLVWQELMFACGMYPRDRGFLELVNDEVRMQVKRLRKYTSIAIWGGNNENENMMEQFAEQEFMPPGTKFNRDIAVADYTKLFVDLIQPIFSSLDSSRPFVDTSPSNGLYSVDPYVKRWGEVNGIAYGDCQDPETFPHARFISEFGFQSAPSKASLLEVSSDEDWDSFHSFWKFLKFRERHENGTTQMLNQLQRRFVVPFPFSDEEWLSVPYSSHSSGAEFGFSVPGRVDSYLYLTQIQQALCYQTAIRTWRRGKNTDLGMTMGILYWQLNDIWQGTSWSSVEFSGRWKSLHYFVKREFAPFIISVHEDIASDQVQVYGVSDIPKQLDVEVVYELRKTRCGSVVKNITDILELSPLESKKEQTFDVDELLAHKETSCTRKSCFLYVRCRSKTPETADSSSLCDDVYHFFAPYKSLHLEKGVVEVVSVKASSPTSFAVTIRSSAFLALFVEMQSSYSRGFWSKNSFLMLPSQTKELTFTGLDDVQPSINDFKKSLDVKWLQKVYEDAPSSVALE